MMKEKGPKVFIVAALLLGVFIFGVAYYGWITATDIFRPVDANGHGRTISIEISKGESTADIADNLQAKGLIRNALAFRVWARIKDLDTHLQAGIYNKLNTSMTISDIIDQLLGGEPDGIRVVIPEGWRIEQIAHRFAAQGLIKFNINDFLRYTEHIDQFPDAAKYPILRSVPSGDSMEGLLFPASYEVPLDASARDVVNMMLTALQATIQGHQLEQTAQQHHLTLYQMLILASVVEREIRFDEDRPGVAAVYWNRVNIPNNETAGFLDADPTVQYARDTFTPPNADYWAPLTDSAKNIVPNSPWNTYTFKGFPPTPICSSGLASMEAAAAPPTSEYFYFLNTKDGHTFFAKTFDEFQRLQQQYQGK
ncbi:MAG: endolytic transglycosylase MltG [Ktedonobacteraceae bacterium]|nr:endolytic transglycosylase MltG [Ktedonobacteraceae bacterium]